MTVNELMLKVAVGLGPSPGIPDGDATAPGDFGERMNEIVGVAKWIGIAVCLLAFIVGAASWAMRYRGGGHGNEEGIGKLVVACVAVALISGAASVVGFFV